MRAHPERLIAALLVFSLGCTTAQTSNTARTATEQLLISNAIDQSLSEMQPLFGAAQRADETQ